MKSPPDPHYRHRFPAEIMSHAVWLYHVFSLSLRDVELLLAERGVVVSYETVRRWCKKFGAGFADRLRSRRPRPGTSGISTRYLSGSRACSTISGVPSIRMALCQHPRSAPAQFKRRETVPQAIAERSRVGAAGDRDQQVAKLRVAQRQLVLGVEHRKSRYLNNRAENSHRPTRRRERQMQRFKSSEQAQDFLYAHSFIYGHFHPRRHQLAAHTYGTIRSEPEGSAAHPTRMSACRRFAPQPAASTSVKARRMPCVVAWSDP
jgi:putative transposase